MSYNAPPSGTSLTASSTEARPRTLDEPVSTTILRDLNRIWIKISYVVYPRHDTMKALSSSWDLWGPLILCLFLACILSYNAPDTQKALVFTGVFVITWVGAAVVTANALLLGGKISFFHTICVLGYCLFPLDVAALAIVLYGNPIFRGIISLVCLAWSVIAALNFFTDLVPLNRRALALYPVFLFYMIFTWMVWIQ